MNYIKIYKSLRENIDFRNQNCLITISIISSPRSLNTFYLVCNKLGKQKIIMLVDGNNLYKMFPLTNFCNYQTDFENKCREILENWGYNYITSPEASETVISVRKIGVIL